MPWQVSSVPALRHALCHALCHAGRSAGRPAAAAADFGVSRRTAHKWLPRFDAATAPAPAAPAPAAPVPTTPTPTTPPGSALRVVSGPGQITVDACRIRLGRGIAGDRARVEDRGHELAVFHCQKRVRCLSRGQRVRGRVL